MYLIKSYLENSDPENLIDQCTRLLGNQPPSSPTLSLEDQVAEAKAFSTGAADLIARITDEIRTLSGQTDPDSLRRVSGLLRLQTKLTLAMGKTLRFVSQQMRAEIENARTRLQLNA